MGNARVYRRKRGARGAGHVGWAFRTDDGDWETGAVERGGFITPPIADGFWCDVLADPNPRMRTLGYDAYKEIEVSMPLVAAGRHAEGEVSRRWFSLVRHNCMNDTYRVLSAYGAGLPAINRLTDWKPNDWFQLLPGEEVLL